MTGSTVSSRLLSPGLTIGRTDLMDSCSCSPILPLELVQSLVVLFLVLLMLSGFFLGLFCIVDRMSEADRRRQ